ncbi:MAG: DivIVA domain-containing protein [Acidimicrobiales bacterium]
MTVTPEQIEGTSFATVKRGGYRTEEVDRFLRVMAEEYRSLNARVRAAEGANEDLQAASQEMATLMRDVHAQLGEKRRIAEMEVQEMIQAAERDAAAVLNAASEQAEEVRAKSDRVLADAEHHADLLRSDGEQRVRERAQETLRAARAELQDLVRRKHEVLHALAGVREGLMGMENTLESTALSPDAIDDDIVAQTLIDLRPSENGEGNGEGNGTGDEPTTLVEPETSVPPADSSSPLPDPGPPPAFGHPSAPPDAGHPASSSTFFSPPDPNDP